MYPNNNSCLNSPEAPVSPSSTAVAVAAMAGLRHQLIAAAAAHSNNSDNNFNFFNSQCANGNASLLISNNSPLQSPHSTPPASPGSNDNLEVSVAAVG